jgi:hypothetical protein
VLRAPKVDSVMFGVVLKCDDRTPTSTSKRDIRTVDLHDLQALYEVTLISLPPLVRWLSRLLTSSILVAISLAFSNPVSTVSAVSSTRSLGTPIPIRPGAAFTDFPASVLLLSTSVLGIVKPCAGRYVISPLAAASRRCFWPVSPARPRTPAMTCMQRRLYSVRMKQ